MAKQDVTCFTCGALCIPEGCTTGYGKDREGNKHCFECCAKRERADMERTGRATLYLVSEPMPPAPKSPGTHETGAKHEVTDWPGRLRFKVWGLSKGRHKMGRVRYDFRFHGPDDFVWSGTQFGDFTQIAHCKRTKERSQTQARS